MAWRKWLALFRRERFTKELDTEIKFHLDQQVAENIAAGMAPEDARRNAMKTFGNATAAKEEAWESWGWTRLEQLAQDVRYALRQLRKSPGFTATAVLTLALGIGANAAIFTLVDSVLMKNLPVADPNTLIRIGDNNDCCVNSGTRDDGNYALFSTEVYEQTKSLPEFENVAAMQAGFSFNPLVVRLDGSQETAHSVMAEFVSGNYFQTFGLRPYAGRFFSAADDVKGAPPVAMMSHENWKTNYGSDPSILGKTFWINTKAVTLVGIAPPGFFGDRLSSIPPAFYLPLWSIPALKSAPYVDKPEAAWLYMIGRVKPSTNLGALQGKVSAIVKHSMQATGKFTMDGEKKDLEKTHVTLVPGGAGIQAMQEQYGSNLRMLMIVSGLVLLIACANIANLLLVRGIRRKTELSLRSALGAAPSRIVRQLLTESVVLAGVGGIAGLIVAYAGAKMLIALVFPDVHAVPIDTTPSGAVLAFAFGLSVITGVLFGIAPAWIASQTEPAEALRSGSRNTSTGATLLQRGLVILQTAVSLVLLVVAGLFSQSLNKLEKSDLKLDPRNRYIVHMDPQAAGYKQTELESVYRTIEQRFHSLPGVKTVGISTYTAMEDNNWGNGIQIQGQPITNEGASIVRVSPEYFNSIGTRVRIGRGIEVQDSPSAPKVAVVNESFVKGFFPPGANPIGRRFGSPGPESSGDFEIVGVVEDTAYNSARWRDHRMYFLPLMQRPVRAKDPQPIEEDSSLYAGAIVVQTEAPMSNMEELARKTLAEINPNFAVVKFQPFDAQIADRFNDERMIARLTALFGGLALLLATIGLYGVTAYTVARRTSEIGIRMALGAQRTGVIAMVMRGAMSQAVIGLAIGVPVALLCVRFVESQLYEIKGVDFRVLIVSVLALILTTSLAGLIPARRAASTDPARTLSAE